jgi:hypothetical protein
MTGTPGTLPAMQAKYHKGHGRDQGVTVTLPASSLF